MSIKGDICAKCEHLCWEKKKEAMFGDVTVMMCNLICANITKYYVLGKIKGNSIVFTEPPENCPYVLEHSVLGVTFGTIKSGKEERHDTE